MADRINKIIYGIFTIFICFIIIFNLYLIVCHYQTRNIYDQFEQIFVYKNFDNYDIALEYHVNSFKKEIAQNGSNTKCTIKRYGAELSNNIGWLKYDVTIYFYNSNNELIKKSTYFDESVEIYIKKINGEWIIDHFKWYP